MQRRSYSHRMCGFTLLEMIAVIFVIGITSAVVIPQLPRLRASLEFALNRDSFERDMNNLTYRAFKSNQDYVLHGIYGESGRIEDAFSSDAKDEWRLPSYMLVLPTYDIPRELPRPIASVDLIPPLPSRWRLSVPEPVQFRSSGYCSGGEADVIVGTRRYRYLLKPPLCEIELEE